MHDCTNMVLCKNQTCCGVNHPRAAPPVWVQYRLCTRTKSTTTKQERNRNEKHRILRTTVPWNDESCGAQSRLNYIMPPPAARKGFRSTRPDNLIISAGHPCPLPIPFSFSCFRIKKHCKKKEETGKGQLDENPRGRKLPQKSAGVSRTSGSEN